jgi:hypothetical protein
MGWMNAKPPWKKCFFSEKRNCARKGTLPAERSVNYLLWESRNEGPIKIIGGQFSYDAFGLY